MTVNYKETAIEIKGITKTFGEVIANNNIYFTVKRGEILALLGENGSGKTTLMNMLSGIYKPDKGSIFVNGKEIIIHSPEDSKRFGIGMVHQHFKLIDIFSAADNIWIGVKEKKYALKEKLKSISVSEKNKLEAFFVKGGKVVAEFGKYFIAKIPSLFLTRSRYKRIKEVSAKYGFEINPKKKVYDMAVSEKQTVEIVKVLYYGADILVLDEPTAVLTVQEIRKLFEVMRKMREKGCAIVIITHKLNEVLEISDRVTILRKGECVGTVNTKDTSVSELTELMVGRKIELSIEHPECEKGEALLSVNNLTVINSEKVKALDGVSFNINEGEIVGIAGVSGSGQRELCEAVAGLQKIEKGEIQYRNENITGKTPRQIIDLGISMSFIPEDRLGMGLAASYDLVDNMMLKSYRKAKGIFVDRKSAAKLASSVVKRLDVVTPNIYTPVRKLSGGNVQKVLLGREIDGNPHLIITAYPVRGLDINSSYTIYNVLNEQKKNGVGVLFIGEDLDVMLELCDRIIVLCHGRITGGVNAKEANKEELGYLMTNDLTEDKGGKANDGQH
ncbi:MAG: ABC transporter ATP-binding protein [Clostridia bacterium]|nr:ABC transporter ATP-binding protein [Clostridia bacterium]